MKKKELLKMIRNSTIMHSTDGYRELYKNYYNSIECTLYAFSDNAEIEISSVKQFKSSDDFERFVRNSSSGDIERLLSNIVSDIRTWIDNRPAEVAVLNKRSRAKKVWFAIFTVVIIATIIAAIVLEGLKISGKFNETLGWVSDAVDGLGLVTGLAFFLYEKIDDLRKNSVHKDYEAAVQSGQDEVFCEKYNVAKSVFGPATVNNSKVINNVTNNYYNGKKDE